MGVLAQRKKNKRKEKRKEKNDAIFFSVTYVVEDFWGVILKLH